MKLTKYIFFICLGICADGSKYFEYSMNSARGSSSIDDLSKIKSNYILILYMIIDIHWYIDVK